MAPPQGRGDDERDIWLHIVALLGLGCLFVGVSLMRFRAMLARQA